MSNSRSGSGATHNEEASGAPMSFPTIALKALEPCDGGCWLVTDQKNDAFQLSYFVNGNSVAVTYIMQPCTTMEQLRQRCSEHLHEVPRSQRTGATVPDPRTYFHATSPASNVQSNSAATSFQTPTPGANSLNQTTTYMHQSSAGLNVDRTQVNNISGSGESAPASSPFVSEPSPTDAMPQQQVQLDWPLSEPHGFMDTDTLDPDWAFSNELFPGSGYPFMNGEFNANFDESGHLFSGFEDTTKLNEDVWNQAEMKESWDSMFTSP